MTAENPDWQQACLPESGTPVVNELGRKRVRSGEEA